MRDILLIARREYQEQVRGRAFKITTILIPVIFAAIIAISVLAGKYSGSGKHFVVAANNAALAEDMRAQLLSDKDANLTVDILAPASDSDREKLVDQVSQKQIDGYLWLTQDANGQPRPFTPGVLPETSPPHPVFPAPSTRPSSSSSSLTVASAPTQLLRSPKA